mgnify:CR=1 FL=1
MFPNTTLNQLGQLIQTTTSEQPAERGKALGIGQQPAHGVPLICHAAELVQSEGAALEPGTLVPKKNGRTQLQAHQNRYQHQQRREQKQSRNSNSGVQDSLAIAAIPLTSHT